MILEMRCNRCDKHIGYISTNLLLLNSKFVKTIQEEIRYGMGTLLIAEMMCDSCREGMVDLEGDQNVRVTDK